MFDGMVAERRMGCKATWARPIRLGSQGTGSRIGLPPIADGHVYPMTGPGLGTRLLPDIARRADARVRRSAA
jgi:hypothetical protein